MRPPLHNPPPGPPSQSGLGPWLWLEPIAGLVSFSGPGGWLSFSLHHRQQPTSAAIAYPGPPEKDSHKAGGVAL